MKNARTFLEILKVNRAAVALASILSVLSNVWLLLPGVLIKKIFDELEGGGSLLDVLLLAVVFFLIYLSRMGIVYQYAKEDTNLRFLIGSRIRINLLNSILSSPSSCLSNKTSGEITNTFRDDVKQIEILAGQFIGIIGTTVFLILAFGILISVNVWVTLIAFVPLMLIVILARGAEKKVTKVRERARVSASKAVSFMNESLKATQLIKLYGIESSIHKRINANNELRAKDAIKDRATTEALDSGYKNLTYFGVATILFVSAGLISEGHLTIGDLSLFLYYLGFISLFANSGGSLLSQIQKTSVSIERITALISEEDLYIDSPANEFEATDEFRNIRLRGVSYVYPNTSVGIRNVDLEINKGTFTLISGKVGSGKTTLLKCILGELTPDKGQLVWTGGSEASFNDRPGSSQCAYTAQTPRFLSDTIRSNIVLGDKIEPSKILKAIATAALDRDIDEFSEGLDTRIGVDGKKVSGGQRKRLAVARMLLRDAQVYVLDDPANALDLSTERELWQNLANNRGSTLIVVSNSACALEFADNIVVLKSGEIISKGSREELRLNCSEFRSIFGFQ